LGSGLDCGRFFLFSTQRGFLIYFESAKVEQVMETERRLVENELSQLMEATLRLEVELEAVLNR